MKIGVIGMGLMGSSLAEKMIQEDQSINIFNRTQSNLAYLQGLGASAYSEIHSFMRDSETIILMLSDYDAIQDVLFESNINSFEGKTVIQMGTIGPEENIEIEKRTAKLRGNYFEAPVLGSIPQISKGELIILVGSSVEQFKKWESLFSLFSNKILHIGKIGDASAIKLALNQLIVSETVAISMSLGYLLEKKIDIDIFMKILRESALYAPTFDKKLPNMLKRSFKEPNFPLKQLLKDLDLILGEFGEMEINTNSLKGIRKILVESIQKGYSENDYSALYNIVHPIKIES